MSLSAMVAAWTIYPHESLNGMTCQKRAVLSQAPPAPYIHSLCHAAFPLESPPRLLNHYSDSPPTVVARMSALPPPLPNISTDPSLALIPPGFTLAEYLHLQNQIG